MKIKCAKCKIVEDISDEDVKLVAHIMRKFNPKPRAVDYVAVLSIIKGDCSDGKKHAFIFHESFDKAVAEIIKEKDEIEKIKAVRSDEITKLNSEIEETEKRIRSLKQTLEDLKQKKSAAVLDIERADMSMKDVIRRLEKLTGTTDVDMWS